MPRQEFLAPNLKLTFFVGTGSFIEDEVDNPIEKTYSLVVWARANQDNDPKLYQMPGITIADIVVKGKIVEEVNNSWIPAALPPEVDLEIPAEGELTIGQQKFSGQFRFIPRLQPIFRSLQERFGESFRGYLKVASRN